MCDEAFGGLIQGLKLEGVLRPGPAYTVHLSMQYKKMLPSRTTVVVSASLDKVESEGRKVWMNAVLSDANVSDGGAHLLKWGWQCLALHARQAPSACLGEGCGEHGCCGAVRY